jgi:Xaa-Pro aminopeptidase
MVDYKSRIERVRARAKKEGASHFYCDNSVDLYYLTGLQLSAGQLIIAPSDATLIVDGRYLERAKRDAPVPVLDQAKEKMSSIVQPGDRLGFDSNQLTFAGYERLKRELPEAEVVPLDALMLRVRSIKDAEEVDLLQQAADLGSRGFDYARSLLKAGISEVEIATQLEIFWLQQGGDRLAFDPIVAFGVASSMPHYRAGASRLKADSVVLLDIGVQLAGYHSDMTRVLFFGRVDREIEKIYEIVHQAFDAAAALCRPGVTCGELDRAARQVIEEAGYGDYFCHSLGHGVGLEIHEYPVLRGSGPHADVVVEQSMVLTIEPGIYLPSRGGVRLEDTFVVTQEGCKSLTCREMRP